MEDKELHDWMIASFGPLQGEAAYAQFSQMPDSIKEQILAQGVDHLPKPEEVKDLVQAFSDGGINTVSDVDRMVDSGPINIVLAKSIALRKAREDSADTVSALQAEQTHTAVSSVNLWLDSATEFDPAPGKADVVTPSGWAEKTIDAWVKLALPVAKSMNEAIASVFADRLGGSIEGEITNMFAGPVPIPIPEGLKDPRKLMEILGSTSFAMQLGQASGTLAHEVFGSFDQGLVMTKNPSGALLPENAEKFAKELELPLPEVLSFLALRESAHSRLYNGVPWLMPRIESLIIKYARGISIDLDAVEEQLRDAEEMNPEGIAGAVNLAKVGMKESDEQKEALGSLETLLALVEGWVDNVVWRAGSPFLPHLEQMREMMRRRRASGGPAEQTFENLIGLKLRPRKLREAAGLWESVLQSDGVEGRDAKWSHPDLLPTLNTPPADDSGQETVLGATPASTHHENEGSAISSDEQSSSASKTTDWDAELSKLLDEEARKNEDLSPEESADENSEKSSDTNTDNDPGTKSNDNPKGTSDKDSPDTGDSSDSPADHA